MIAAVIDPGTGIVVNVIVISDGDAAPPGTAIAPVPTGTAAESGWRYTEDRGFLSPSAQRFYTFGVGGVATEIDIATARSIVSEDIVTEASALKTTYDDGAYRSAVDAAAADMASRVDTLTFAECVAFRAAGWPRMGGA